MDSGKHVVLYLKEVNQGPRPRIIHINCELIMKIQLWLLKTQQRETANPSGMFSIIIYFSRLKACNH